MDEQIKIVAVDQVSGVTSYLLLPFFSFSANPILTFALSKALKNKHHADLRQDPYR
jgi:hypothetical protein